MNVLFSVGLMIDVMVKEVTIIGNLVPIHMARITIGTGEAGTTENVPLIEIMEGKLGLILQIITGRRHTLPWGKWFEIYAFSLSSLERGYC